MTIKAVLLLCVTAVVGVALASTPKAQRRVRERVVMVDCNSTKGSFEITVHPSWSPIGARRYLKLVNAGFYNNTPLFRVAPNFLVQFGISLDAAMNQKFGQSVQDDPKPPVPFKKGIMAFAGSGKDSRGTQVFIGYEGAAGLGHSPWETPFGEVTKGMENVDKFYGGYGDNVDQGKLHTQGKAYLDREFPKLDYLHYCTMRTIRGLSGKGGPVGKTRATVSSEGSTS